MIKISKYYLVRNLTNDSNEIWGYQQVQTLLDTLGVTLKQLNLRFGHFISIDGSYNNLNGDAVEVTTDPTSMYVKLLQTGSQFGIWNRKVNTNLDDYTVSLLHFDESTTKDECGNIWNITGNPTLTTTNAKFGKAVELSSSSYLTFNSSISLGNQNFTIDFWGYSPPQNSDYYSAFFALDAGDSYYLSVSANSGKIIFHRRRYDNNIIEDTTSSIRHFACVYIKNTDTITFYIDGNSKFSGLLGYNDEKQFTLSIGSSRLSANSQLKIVDEFRISDGIARWTDNFTPPNEPYKAI